MALDGVCGAEWENTGHFIRVDAVVQSIFQIYTFPDASADLLPDIFPDAAAADPVPYVTTAADANMVTVASAFLSYTASMLAMLIGGQT